jgi:hypothetical protein
MSIPGNYIRLTAHPGQQEGFHEYGGVKYEVCFLFTFIRRAGDFN